MEPISYHAVGWEQGFEDGGTKTFSYNRTFLSPYQHAYNSTEENPWDYSILMIITPWTRPQIRCYVMYLDSEVRYSSWSNITMHFGVTSEYTL